MGLERQQMEKTIVVRAKDVSDAYGISMDGAYETLKAVAHRLPICSATIDGRVIPWVRRAEYQTGCGQLEIEWSSEMREHVNADLRFGESASD
jgi:hypothetical protein